LLTQRGQEDTTRGSGWFRQPAQGHGTNGSTQCRLGGVTLVTSVSACVLLCSGTASRRRDRSARPGAEIAPGPWAGGEGPSSTPFERFRLESSCGALFLHLWASRKLLGGLLTSGALDLLARSAKPSKPRESRALVRGLAPTSHVERPPPRTTKKASTPRAKRQSLSAGRSRRGCAKTEDPLRRFVCFAGARSGAQAGRGSARQCIDQARIGNASGLR